MAIGLGVWWRRSGSSVSLVAESHNLLAPLYHIREIRNTSFRPSAALTDGGILQPDRAGLALIPPQGRTRGGAPIDYVTVDLGHLRCMGTRWLSALDLPV